MASPQRQIKFKTKQDWFNFRNTQTRLPPEKQQDLLLLRRQIYADIEKVRQRPLLVYFADFTKPLNSIDHTDIEGFVDFVNLCTEDTKTVDVLLHSPGGQIDSTERIVKILRNKFEEVHFLIPHSAYSAATMLALSGNSIVMHSSAVLGPIDPQIGGIPASAIKTGFNKAKDAIAKGGAEILPAYMPLIEKYSLHLLEQCEDSATLAKTLVESWLTNYMFKNEENVASTIKKAVTYFSDYNEHLLHSRPISWNDLEDNKLSLKIELADGKLKELLREAYIVLNGFLEGSLFIKLYENVNGLSWGPSIPPLPPPPQISPFSFPPVQQ